MTGGLGTMSPENLEHPQMYVPDEITNFSARL